MTPNIIKNIKKHYKVLYGEKGKKYYVLSKDFWNYIQSSLNNNKFKDKRSLGKHIVNITKGNITQRGVDSWFYHKRQPIIIDNLETKKYTNNGCKHGFEYFCPLCEIDKFELTNCPVPLFWTTHSKGKLYVYDKYWDELKYWIDNSLKYGLLLSNIYKYININDREVRSWTKNKHLPKKFSKDEFTFSQHNLYFLGLFLSDGHIRNNGSKLSFTYQVGSNDIFQGYWHPQLIQKILPIFKHKKKISNTYLLIENTWNKFMFKTNVSSISPVFIQYLIRYNLMEKRRKSKTSGWKKNIPKNFLDKINSYQEYFQGVMDGDGHYGIYTSPNITLAMTYEIDYSFFIDSLPLIPTLCAPDRKKSVPYIKRKNNWLRSISFAPSSLKNISKKYAILDIVKQLEFFIESAHNSIRPDKVYKLVKIIKRITSSRYGENTNSLPIQREIRDLANKHDLRSKAKMLEKRYPINNNRYMPFLPKWLEPLCSKNEAWNFFYNKENLVFKKKNKNLEKLNFSKGIPLNLDISESL